MSEEKKNDEFMPGENKTVELNDEELEKVSGGKNFIPTCDKQNDAGLCYINDYTVYFACHYCRRNPNNLTYNPLTGTYE